MRNYIKAIFQCNRLNRTGYMAGIVGSFLLMMVFAFVVSGAAMVAGVITYIDDDVFATLLGMFWMGIVIYLAVKRMHDTGHSGWFVCAAFIPIVNFFVGFALLFAPGTKAENKYGPPFPMLPTSMKNNDIVHHDTL